MYDNISLPGEPSHCFAVSNVERGDTVHEIDDRCRDVGASLIRAQNAPNLPHTGDRRFQVVLRSLVVAQCAPQDAYYAVDRLFQFRP